MGHRRALAAGEDGSSNRPVVRVVVDGVEPSDATGFQGTSRWLPRGAPGEIADAERGGPMFYTSGTTGRPRASAHARRSRRPAEVLALIAHALAPTMELSTAGGSMWWYCGPIYHSAQWVFARFALICGDTVVLQHRFDAESCSR